MLKWSCQKVPSIKTADQSKHVKMSYNYLYDRMKKVSRNWKTWVLVPISTNRLADLGKFYSWSEPVFLVTGKFGLNDLHSFFSSYDPQTAWYCYSTVSFVITLSLSISGHGPCLVLPQKASQSEPIVGTYHFPTELISHLWAKLAIIRLLFNNFTLKSIGHHR